MWSLRPKYVASYLTRNKSSIHLSVVLLEGLVLLNELLLALLAGELEHGNSVDAVCHFDGC